MKAYGVNELRRMYLDFFEKKEHLKMKSCIVDSELQFILSNYNFHG